MSNFGKLYIIGLPIGNWEDISVRALNHLKIAKNIVMESQVGLNRIFDNLGITKNNINFISMQITSVNGSAGFSNEVANLSLIIDLLKSGQDVYIISDEGMPGFADPGELIVKTVIQNGIDLKVIPGPTAAMIAIAMTGCSSNFTFESFPPEGREERRKFLLEKKFLHAPMVFVLRNRVVSENGTPQFHPEIPDLLLDAYEILGEDRHAALCYNLTKDNEKIVRGTFLELHKYFTERFREDDQISIVIDTHDHAFSRMNTSKVTNG
jgi:16S rRNA (cytidine1402-2'-O)-methyltransferase